MLTQIIATAAQQAAVIAQRPGVPGDVAAHMRAFGGDVLPAVSTAQQAVGAFAGEARGIVERLLQSPASPGDASADARLAALRQALGPLVSAIQAAEAHVAAAVRALDSARGQFTTDQQKLATERSNAVARLEGARANKEHWDGEAQRLRDRALWTSIIGSFIWLVKIADEIASAIQYRKSTEEALANASQELHNAQGNLGALETAVQLYGTLAGLVGQLTNSVQNLANAVGFLASALTNQKEFAEITTPETETLYLTALRSSLIGLEQEVV